MTIYQGYLITSNPASPSLLKVAVAGQGGKIPDVLSGSFTSFGAVKEVIDHYLIKREAEGKKNERKTSPKE